MGRTEQSLPVNSLSLHSLTSVIRLITLRARLVPSMTSHEQATRRKPQFNTFESLMNHSTFKLLKIKVRVAGEGMCRL